MVEGGVDTTIDLLREKFDYIFFTGSGPIGQKIREAANKFLTPVTLELGGEGARSRLSPEVDHRPVDRKVSGLCGQDGGPGHGGQAAGLGQVHQPRPDLHCSGLRGLQHGGGRPAG